MKPPESLPWAVAELDDWERASRYVRARSGRRAVVRVLGPPQERDEAADYLVAACNGWPGLVAALEPILAAADLDCPGTADLWDEQPVSGVTLGHVRAVARALSGRVGR